MGLSNHPPRQHIAPLTTPEENGGKRTVSYRIKRNGDKLYLERSTDGDEEWHEVYSCRSAGLSPRQHLAQVQTELRRQAQLDRDAGERLGIEVWIETEEVTP